MEDEDTYPSINSESAAERILARRQRIVKTLEAHKNGSITKDQQSEKDKEVSNSETQVTQSNQSLSHLITGSSELVSNVEVACQARIIALREQENIKRKLRLEKLENEAKSAAETFNNITNKWEVSLKNDDSQKLQKILLSQQKACCDLIEGKNLLIREFQQDLKKKDDQFVQDLLKQAKDVDLILERMEEQIKTLKKAYRFELDSIENAFFSERNDLLHTQKNKWELRLEFRRQKETEYMELKEKRAEEMQIQIQMLRVEDAEEYNILKAKLENEIQVLEQNLQQMKETCQLNQEKLEYNFQVLKKRDEENMITKSQQKRKITRLQDFLNGLNQKLKKQEKQSSDESLTLTSDLKRITEQYQELQKKFCHFQITDNKKFEDIWIMNENSTKDLMNDVLKLDEIITKQQLGLDWSAPNLESINASPLHKTKEIPYTDLAQEGCSLEFNSDLNINKKPGCCTSTQNLKTMLKILCDESGFLVESKLAKLLAPINKNEQSLVTLDAIFNALSIESVQDMEILSEYFFKAQNVDKLAEVLNDDKHEGVKSSSSTKHELIQPNTAIKVLRSFLEENNNRLASDVSPQQSNDTHHNHWREYFEQLLLVIDCRKERLWDGLTEGFEMYNKVLNERALLIQDTDSLRQQNAELKMLLRQYLSSKVNQQLLVPPSQLLSLDFSRN